MTQENKQNPSATTQSKSDTTEKTNQSDKQEVTPLKCLLSSVFAGVMAFGVYHLMSAIVTTYSAKPIISDNIFVLKLTIAVRTLVIGVAALGTGVFGFVALGLFLLGLQITFKDFSKKFSN